MTLHILRFPRNDAWTNRFEATAPLPRATRSPDRGTGLGLSVVKSIVTGLGGRVEVQSEVGKGTRFTIDLPAAPPDRGK